MTNKVGLVLCLVVLRFHPAVVAGTLKPETKAAWDAYLQDATAAMQARLKPGVHFLWIDEEPDRAAFVRTHGPYIAPVGPHIPKKVPSGLIHDWIGVGFVPNAKIEDILRVVRDYDRYKDVYRPGVIDSISHGTDGPKDLFTLRLANRSVVAKTALDTDCEASYIRVDDRHWYGFSNTIHIQEIEKFGTPQQRTLPEDEGTGLIWRLSSITRLEERDGGVYAELEAIALSRDIPAAFRVFVTPIVRRVSRDSMATSLQQTKVALDAEMASRTAADTVVSRQKNSMASQVVGTHESLRHTQ
ncbi:MAG TPA: hypothetical protein VH351_07580 [Bryobacteraceae bacterium]|jgi:hypothetical protein|nr:hypothetical protein [Bryobacteraceae bacterium]